VIIPAYNAARYVAAAIESALHQSVPPLEVVVVDDESSDGTAAVAAAVGAPVRCVRQPHAGAGPARNLGVRESRGEHLAFLDADDLWTADKLRLQLTALREHPGIAMVFGHVEEFLSEELTPAERSRIVVREGSHPGILAQTMLIARADFLRVGEFSAAWKLGEFMEWYARAKELGLGTLVVPLVVGRRRLHGGNLGIRERGSRTDYARILKESLDRRRRRPVEG
jgi:glycosyltransferase involved in cell wall biosynthesis